MSLPFNPQTLFDLADKLGLIQAIKSKLLRQPKVAADKLIIVLGELSKIYTSCDAELLKYLSPSIDKDYNDVVERKPFFYLKLGKLKCEPMKQEGYLKSGTSLSVFSENRFTPFFHPKKQCNGGLVQIPGLC